VKQQVSGILPDFDATGVAKVVPLPASAGQANDRNPQLARRLRGSLGGTVTFPARKRF
jgi:hypothetical protein